MRAEDPPTRRARARVPSCGYRAARARGRWPGRPAARQARWATETSTHDLRATEVVQDDRADGAVAGDAGVPQATAGAGSLLRGDPALIAGAVRLQGGQA